MFRLALRQTEGLIGSIIALLGLELAVPDHTTLSRRAETLGRGSFSARLRSRAPAGGQYGAEALRLRRMAVGEARQEDTSIVAQAAHRRGCRYRADRSGGADHQRRRRCLPGQVPYSSQVDGPVASFTADGAYDQDGVYGEVFAHHPEASVIVPPRSNAVPSDTAETAPTMRDRHLQIIAERGRMAWQRAAGYNWRALVEADISRLKRIIGDGLRSRTDPRRVTEVAIAVKALNQMLDLGRPEYIRLP